MKYSNMDWGTMEAVVNKLGGMEGVRRFLNGEILLNVPQFDVWKTIKLGTGLKTAADFVAAFTGLGMKIGTWGNDIIGQPAFTASDTETEVDLVNVSVAELGFPKGAKRSDIYERALSYGLELCPNEVAPQLRLQYKDQPSGEWLRIAMEPIADSDRDLEVFEVGHDDDGLYLYGFYGRPDDFWGADRRWVFVRRKQ